MQKYLLGFTVCLLVGIALFGCIRTQPTGGMQPPAVCPNMCLLNQTQAPYPGCTCSGGTSGGSGGTGGTSDIGGTGGTGGSGGTGQNYASGGQEYSDVLLSGGLAAPRSQQGELIVVFSSTNYDSTIYRSIPAVIGEVSVFVAGSGAGWANMATGNESIEFTALRGKRIPVSWNRVWAGKYTRLAIEFAAMNATVRNTGQTENVSMPKKTYVFIVMAPVTYGATSAIEISFDMNKSFTRSENTTIFTPSVTITSMHGIQYIQREDGSVDLYSGATDLFELAEFNRTGGASYHVLSGTSASCMEGCVSGCALSSAPMCHAGCASTCLGEVVPPMPNACSDGTEYGQCSVNRPFWCTNTGQYDANCQLCGCPENCECLSDDTCKYSPVAGGVATCSGNACVAGNPPIACRNGQLTQDCGACGCPSGMTCRSADGVCVQAG